MWTKVIQKASGWLRRRSYPVYAWHERRHGFVEEAPTGPIPKFQTPQGKSLDAAKILADLKRDGVVEIPDFFSPQQMDQWRGHCATLLEEAIADGSPREGSIFDGKYRLEANPQGDGVSRLYHIEKAAPEVTSFTQHELFRWIGENYYGRPIRLETSIYQYNQVTKAGTRDWHIDSWLNQFKAFLYLSDVTEESGPFTYLIGSHKNDSYLLQKAYRSMRGWETTSVADADARALGLPERRFTGRRGTVLLADTKGIHQGGTLIQGDRSALVNYFYLQDDETHNYG